MCLTYRDHGGGRALAGGERRSTGAKGGDAVVSPAQRGRTKTQRCDAVARNDDDIEPSLRLPRSVCRYGGVRNVSVGGFVGAVQAIFCVARVVPPF